MNSSAGNSSLRLAVPSTQNTAPVLDFSCLYTHDIRRKAKRWQDGIIRFHTFNNRVMVYDISRNFVGDTHWREPNPIQDGDDLELDKGVLIKVGESTGSTDQDLSGLIKKRRNPGIGSPGRTSSVQPTSDGAANSASVPLSQLRPRTLTSLLKMPKGPLGRAVIPLKSPCQLRKETGYNPTVEARRAKRQRVGTTIEKATISFPEPNFRSEAATSTLSYQRNSNMEGGRMVEKSSTTRLDPVVSKKISAQLEKSLVRPNPDENFNPDDSIKKIYSGDLSTTSLDPALRKNRNAREKYLVKPIQKELSNRDVPTETFLPGGLSSSPNSRRSSSKSSSSKGGKQAAPGTNTNSGAQEKLQEANIEIVNQLQIISRKPRKKLMHQNLIPQAISSTTLSEEQNSNRSKNNTEYLGEPEVDPQARFHRAQHDRLKARLKVIEEKGRNYTPETGGADSPQLIDSDDDAESSPSIPDSVKERSPDILPGLIASGELQRRKIARFTPFTKSLISPSIGPDSMVEDELDRIDQILLQNTQKPEARSFSKACSLQPRMRSPSPQQPTTSELPDSAQFPTIDSGSTLPSPPPPVPQNRPLSPRGRPLRTHSLPKGQSKRGPRSPLRKTNSNPAALRRHSVSERQSTPPAVAQDQKPDPWSREAWDLFGYGRPEKKEGEA
ncbi:hypothetical protein MMC07_004150 [Pseudocyphellaria aurata]|nr:hypothetical protein [Pseudocyphellaria aurata]